MQAIQQLLRHLPVWVVWAFGVVPLGWLMWAAVYGGLGTDPVKEIEHSLGLWGFQFLIASLTITPLRWLGLNLIRYRRALGVTSFIYILLHLLAWIILDMGLRFNEMGQDLIKRPYIILGMIGFLALLPLALTSTDAAIRRLGPKRWRQLHRLAYLAVLAGAAHFVILVKSWPPEPLIYAAIVIGLLFARIIHAQKAKNRVAHS